LPSPFPSVLSNPKLFLDRDGTHPVTSVVIVSHHPRPVSLPRHPGENPAVVTPFVSHPYKCPLRQLLSLDILTNARGVGGVLSFSIRACVTASPMPSPRKSFKCNTCGHPRKCCKQKTYGISKPFRCNTYKKTGGGLSLSIDVQTFRPSDVATARSIAPRNRQCHNEPTAQEFFAFRGNNSAPPGV
jgi:hypothetical protein